MTHPFPTRSSSDLIVRLAKTGDVVQPEKALFDLRSYPSFQSGGLDQAGDNPVTANSLLAEGRRDGLDIPVHHGLRRSEEHTSELQSLMRISYAVFCLQQKKYHAINTIIHLP